MSARVSRALYAHPRGRLGLLLGPAVLWLLVFYIVALILLLLTSLWQQDVFTAKLVHSWTFDNYKKLFGEGGLWMRVQRPSEAADQPRTSAQASDHCL